ncbi:MAG: hypothetical protein E7541_06910 [Ruminococcaceae bacterium]|nr:hypothetical protein [Oscillospiraceae bacterium]
MSDLLRDLTTDLSDLLSFFVTIALLQNIVLTTGFGSSLVMHTVRKPKNIWPFTGVLTFFSVMTVLLAYPLDRWLGTAITNYWRPVILSGITVALYVLITPICRRWLPRLYSRVSSMLPVAAFNNLVFGIALVANVKFHSGLGGIIGLAIGSCLAFGTISWITAEGIERLDNPDMPDAFRGMPATLVYIGLVALALMGFTSDFKLI